MFYVEAQESSLQVTNHTAQENLQNEAQVPFLVAYVLCHLETPKVGLGGCPAVMLHEGLHKWCKSWLRWRGVESSSFLPTWNLAFLFSSRASDTHWCVNAYFLHFKQMICNLYKWDLILIARNGKKLSWLLWYCIVMSPFSFKKLKPEELDHLVHWCQSPALSLRSKAAFPDWHRALHGRCNAGIVPALIFT